MCTCIMGVARIFRRWGRGMDECREITQNNSHYAIQGHSRSPILVPMESTCATSYVWIIVSYVLSCTFPRYDDWWIISSNFRCRNSNATQLFLPQALNSVSQTGSPETWETPSIVWCKAYFDLEPFKCGSRVWQTAVIDRQTDRLRHNKCHTSLGWAAEKRGRSIVATPKCMTEWPCTNVT